MDQASTTYKVHQCSKCPGDTEYYCQSCQCDLCQKCNENHVKNLQTIDHKVVSHHEKFNNIPAQEICVRHPSHVYIKYCEPCQVPVCDSCFGHKSHRFPVSLFRHSKHKTFSLRGAFKTKRQQHRGTIHTIRSEALFYRPVLLPGITDDIKTCRTEFSRYQSEMLTKAKRMKYLINIVLNDLMINVLCDFVFKHRCLEQKIKMVNHIVSLQRYVCIYEQRREIRPLQFLTSIKTAFRQIYLTLHTSQLSMTESLKKEGVIKSLSAIQITERGNRRLGNQCLLKMMSGAEVHQSLTVTGVGRCHHISNVTSDRVWVSDDRNNLILTNTAGALIYRVKDSCSGLYGGLHTVNNENELIYIDRKYNINKRSKDINTNKTLLTKKIFSKWRPWCVYWSPSTGDLLVGVYRKITQFRRTGKVTRYNQSGQLTQTIHHDNTGMELYTQPRYITENNNGDLLVSDYNAVVVTERGGRHRFSYTGHPSGSGLWPRGICTDALSHILVCDGITNTVQMFNEDGTIHIIRPPGIFYPRSLSYDVNTQRLWIGSGYNNKVVIYRYIARQDILTDTAVKLQTNQLPMTASLNKEDVMESLSAIQITERENRRVGNQCLLKLTSVAKLHQSFTVTGVNCCCHIFCMTSDRVWVSDGDNLILTNTTGVPLHRVEELRNVLFIELLSDLYRGLHTVNNESELIYIDRKYNINKLSKDMKTTTTFIDRTDSTWIPRCVYWSPSTDNLLVGLYRDDSKIGMVTRYNQSGKLTTIQHGNNGPKLYRNPRYITENNNGDLVVSDYNAVVVTEREGRHRFSYTGHPSRSVLRPYGICTDALSHILVCDHLTKTVQMIDRDGQFLSNLLTKSQEMGAPRVLSYNFNTHRLWVGSQDNNKVCVYSYIDRHDALTDEETHSTDWEVVSSSSDGIEAMLSSTPAVKLT